MIKTIRDLDSRGIQAFTESMVSKLRGRLPGGDFIEDCAVFAEINQGRWLAHCPFCTGAELIDLQDPRFFCLSCMNEKAQRRWVHVVLPKNFQAIEVELLKRKEPQHQNWLPGETVQMLKDERKKAGES